MSKTDQMRALREARFTRASAAAPRRVPPAPISAVQPRASRPTPPVDERAPSIDIVAETAAVDQVVAEPLTAEAAGLGTPTTVTPPFEIPTLDIPLPTAVPRVRDTLAPVQGARTIQTPQAPASEQIIIPALDLPEASSLVAAPASSPSPSPEDPSPERTSTDTPIASSTTVTTLGHGVVPGLPIASYTQEDLALVVRWVNRDNLPRGATELVSAAMSELGFKRRSKKITDAITAAAISIGALGDQPAAADLDGTAIAS